MIASIICNPTPWSTPVISANTPVFRCSSVTPSQVTHVTRVNAPEFPSLQISKATATSLSSLSAKTQANINEGNDSFKRMDCTPATAVSSTSQAVSTLLSTAPGPQVASLSHPCHLPWVLTVQASACSRPPCHLPDHMTSALGIPVTLTTQQPSAMLHPPWHPPDHVIFNSAVSMPLSSEQQATLTQGCIDASPAYINSMLDLCQMVTACIQFSQ